MPAYLFLVYAYLYYSEHSATSVGDKIEKAGGEGAPALVTLLYKRLEDREIAAVDPISPFYAGSTITDV
jgi:hypothetical protein